MTKARLAKPRRSPKHASALERLEPGEAHTLLRRLLAAHSDLQAEAEQTARSLLGEVTFENVADDVEQGLRSLDIEDLGRRAGRHRGSYTTPSEAAWELLQEAVDPLMFEQWRIAFEIGRRNRERGVRPATLRELVGLAVLTRCVRSPGSPPRSVPARSSSP